MCPAGAPAQQQPAQQGQQGQQQEAGDHHGGAVAEIEEAHRLQIGIQGQAFGAARRAAAGEHLHQIEQAQGLGQPEQHRQADPGAEQRQDQTPQDLRAARPLQAQALLQLHRDRLQTGQQQQRHEGRALPYIRHHGEQPGGGGGGQKAVGLAAQGLDQPIERSVGGLEDPAPAEGQHRARQRPGQQGKGPQQAAAATGAVQQQRHRQPQHQFQHHRHQREAQREGRVLPEAPIAEQPLPVGATIGHGPQAREQRAGLAAEPDRLQQRPQEHDRQQQEGRQHQPGHRPVPPPRRPGGGRTAHRTASPLLEASSS